MNPKILELIEKGLADAELGKISRRDFGKWLFKLSIASGISLVQLREAAAWVGTRTRKAKRPVASQPLVYKSSYFDIVNAALYTFNSVDFGTESADRRIIVCAAPQRDADVNARLDGVTIGGVVGTQVIKVDSARYTCGIYIAHVPTNADTSVVVDVTSTVYRCSIGVYAAYGLSSSAALHTASSTAEPAGATVNTAGGGFVVAAHNHIRGGDGFNWTNATEDYFWQPSEDTLRGASFASATNTSAGTLQITSQSIGLGGANLSRMLLLASWSV